MLELFVYKTHNNNNNWKIIFPGSAPRCHFAGSEM